VFTFDNIRVGSVISVSDTLGGTATVKVTDVTRGELDNQGREVFTVQYIDQTTGTLVEPGTKDADGFERNPYGFRFPAQIRSIILF
jgi:hypothetical protein